MVYKWFRVLNSYNINIYGFVIMPNHVHCILDLHQSGQSLNSVVANGKRFIAYGLIKLLQETKQHKILQQLSADLSNREIKEGKKHRVFKTSFDAQICSDQLTLEQFLQNIHANPVSNKWSLTDDYTNYFHSSARFYETDENHSFNFELTHYLDE